MNNLIELLQQWIPFLAPYPIWVKVLISIWVFITGGIIIGLLFFRSSSSISDNPSHIVQESETPRVESESLKPDSKKSLEGGSKGLKLSFEEYYSEISRLEDRFLERDEFIKSLLGKEISWVGYVAQVSQSDGTGKILMLIRVSKNKMDSLLALVSFQSEFRTKLFSLRKEDRVKVIGLYKSGRPVPEIEGSSIELLSGE